jgi:hypothetical protein
VEKDAETSAGVLTVMKERRERSFKLDGIELES